MANTESQQRSEIGMIGLGVMGRNLLLNMAHHGFSVAGFDKDLAKVEALHEESKEVDVRGANDIKEFISMLRIPRAVMMLVPAGAPVDAVVADLLPYLQEGDLIIDAGNSYFKDTNRRIQSLDEKGIQFVGIGISGGEEGARKGPSIMPGGTKETYERLRPLFEAVSAKVNGEACVTYLGTGSAGHFVKMVHNGIEYALMQLISESYDIMKRGLNLNDDELQTIFDTWNKGALNSFLLEITGHIFGKVDEKTGKRIVDEILDVARQKGTGMWTSQNAMELQIPTPTIDISVAMRDMSVYEAQRIKASSILYRPIKHFQGDREVFLKQLHNALLSGMIIAYAQGLSLLSVASKKYLYNLDLEAVARIWRGGCIIRSALLEDIRMAFRNNWDLPNIMLDPVLSKKIMENQEDLRKVVSIANELGIPALGLTVSLGYFDAYRSSWLPTNLIQAQRDYFGAHTYERVDAKGTFHTKWEE
jgi:6-phosphogluconate dehydrogenase